MRAKVFFTHLLSFVLCLVMLAPMLAACTDGKETNDQTTTGDKDPETTTDGSSGGKVTTKDSAGDPVTPGDDSTGDDATGDDTGDTTDPFKPSDIAGMVAHFDASTLELSDGDKVTEWDNLAGDRYDAVSYNDRNAPTFKAQSDVGGKPGVVFGKDSGLKLEDSNGVRIDDVTIIAVVLPLGVEGNNDNNLIFDKLETSGGYNHTWYFNINGASQFNFGWKDTNGAYHDCGDPKTTLTMSKSYILTGVKSETTGYLYLNGELSGTTQSGVSGVVGNNEYIYIGKPQSFGRSIDGTVCEILMYDRAITSTENYSLQKYLSNKWGIEVMTNGFIPDNTVLEISVGGEQIRNLSLAQTSYKYSLAKGTTAVPQISASATTDGKPLKLTVTQATSTSGKATVKIDEYDLEYTVNFSVLSEDLAGLSYPDVADVEITDGFWSERLDQYAKTTVYYALDKLVEQGAIKNFENVINKRSSVYNNPWEDGLLFETITAAADLMAANPDPALKAKIDAYIDVVYNASMTSKTGYLSTHQMIQKPDKYFDESGNARWYHDCYNFGCMVEAGTRYYKATGDMKLLYVAVRFAEFIVDNYGYGTKADGSPKVNMVPSHSLPEETLLQLYIILRNEKGLKEKLESYSEQYPLSIDENEYADLVKFWIENRGNMERRQGNYGSYAQDDMYYFDQTVAEGHAVRANLFYTGMAAAGIEFENYTCLESAHVLWHDIYEKQMYVNGSTGSTSNDEAYGGDYDLPNSGYCETCASSALAFFTGYMSLAFEDSTYADTLENIMYNAILGGIGQDGRTFYYVQPLNSSSNARWNWNDCPCCVPMFLKFVSRLSTYIYAYDDSRVFINQFISSSATLASGVRLEMTTGMPYYGNCTVKVIGGSTQLWIRIPAWAEGVTLKINGVDASYTESNGYAVISVKAGDTVSYDMQLGVRRIYADPNVKADVGRVTLAYGPIIYCIEGIDNKDFTGVSSNQNAITIAKDSAITATYDEDLLDGVFVLTFEAFDTSNKTHTATAVPFYARLNRGTTSAYVWLREK